MNCPVITLNYINYNPLFISVRQQKGRTVSLPRSLFITTSYLVYIIKPLISIFFRHHRQIVNAEIPNPVSRQFKLVGCQL